MGGVGSCGSVVRVDPRKAAHISCRYLSDGALQPTPSDLINGLGDKALSVDRDLARMPRCSEGGLLDGAVRADRAGVAVSKQALIVGNRGGLYAT